MELEALGGASGEGIGERTGAQRRPPSRIRFLITSQAKV